MARDLSIEELKKHKTDVLNIFSSYLDSLIESDSSRQSNKADKLCFWLKDWTTFLKFEESFSPSSLRSYKRGEIIKAHLGFNVGSEEGGLHYCVVIDKKNSIHSPVLTVIPLTSVKNNRDLNTLPSGKIYLGNELFVNLSSKISTTEKVLNSSIENLENAIIAPDPYNLKHFQETIEKQLIAYRKNKCLLDRMQKEISKMKLGSIALVNQIRTISKIRIYDPKTNYDILSNVKLSNEKLDMIDMEITRFYTGHRL